MSETYEPLFCTACDAITAHVYLSQGRYECTDGDCAQVRTFHLSDDLYGQPKESA